MHGLHKLKNKVSQARPLESHESSHRIYESQTEHHLYPFQLAEINLNVECIGDDCLINQRLEPNEK